jgi:hypothetical protein
MAHDYAIITPTYRPHFKYVSKYLESYTRYVTSGSVPIYFVISRDEAAEFELIITSYRSCDVDINVLFFEDILSRFGISTSPAELLNRYGRFTFQTMKKMYAMLATDAERFLVLDSESMWINLTDMRRVFANFFAAPFVSGTPLNAPYRTSANFRLMCENIDFLLGFKCHWWLLENFVWFYEKRILSDLFAACGPLIGIAERLFARNDSLPGLRDIKNGIFEITLYQNFVFHNRAKYGYAFNDLDKELARVLPPGVLARYKDAFHKHFQGECGLMEYAPMFLAPDNVQLLAELFCRLRFNIIRCEGVSELALQRHFMERVRPAILAASQDHAFGLHDNPAGRIRILLKTDKSWNKCKKHWRKLFHPEAFKLKSLVEEPAAIISYGLRVFWMLSQEAVAILAVTESDCLEGANYLSNMLYFLNRCIHYCYHCGKVKAEVLEIWVGMKCTLRCKYCAHLIPHMPQISFETEQVIADIKKTLALCKPMRFNISGGEPFTHPEIHRILNALADILDGDATIGPQSYIITNGSVMPTLETLEALKRLKGKIAVFLDVYPPQRQQALRFERVLQDNGLYYIKNYEDSGFWVDVGSIDFPGHSSIKRRLATFHLCMSKNCISCADGRLSTCYRGIVSHKAFGPKSRPFEVLDLRKVRDNALGRALVAACINHKTSKSFCQYCKGMNLTLGRRIPPAEQIQPPGTTS